MKYLFLVATAIALMIYSGLNAARQYKYCEVLTDIENKHARFSLSNGCEVEVNGKWVDSRSLLIITNTEEQVKEKVNEQK